MTDESKNIGKKSGKNNPPVEHQFKVGNSGGGRPKGSRNKLGEAFLDDLYADWKENGKEVINAVRADKPEVYMKVVASILPKDLNINVNKFEELSDEDLKDRLRDLQSYLGPLLGPETGTGIVDGTEKKRTH